MQGNCAACWKNDASAGSGQATRSVEMARQYHWSDLPLAPAVAVHLRPGVRTRLTSLLAVAQFEPDDAAA
jgi:hypothetical protein